MANAKPRVIYSNGTDHLLANQHQTVADLAARAHPFETACGRKVFGIAGNHEAGEFRVRCGNCRRTALYAEARRAVWLHNNSALIAHAEAYVRTRFFPPLPVEYGALAVEAVEAVNDDDPYKLLDVSDLPVTPRAARDGKVTAARLVQDLRLSHMIDDDAADIAYLEV